MARRVFPGGLRLISFAAVGLVGKSLFRKCSGNAMYNALYMAKALHFAVKLAFDSAKQLFYQAVEQLPITFVETLVAPIRSRHDKAC